MASICDRSPCDKLLSALGDHIWGTKDGFVLALGEGKEIPITYCPFCGTRLDQVSGISRTRDSYLSKRKNLKSAQP